MVGFEETLTFKVKNTLMNWKWISYSKKKAYNDEQMENDRKNMSGYLTETFGINLPVSTDWEGGIFEPRFGAIILQKENLIRFD